MPLTQVKSGKSLWTRFYVAARGQYEFFKKAPARYIFSEVLPLPAGGTIYDLITGHSPFYNPHGEETIIEAFKKHQAMLAERGLQTQPLLLRAFSREWRQGASEFQKLPVMEQRESYGQKAAALGKYLSELKTMNAKAKLAARFARGEKLQAQHALGKVERQRPVGELNLKPRVNPLVFIQRGFAARIQARKTTPVVAANRERANHFDAVSRVPLPKPAPKLFLRSRYA